MPRAGAKKKASWKGAKKDHEDHVIMPYNPVTGTQLCYHFNRVSAGCILTTCRFTHKKEKVR